jgi:hypothetical protein
MYMLAAGSQDWPRTGMFAGDECSRVNSGSLPLCSTGVKDSCEEVATTQIVAGHEFNAHHDSLPTAHPFGNQASSPSVNSSLATDLLLHVAAHAQGTGSLGKLL